MGNLPPVPLGSWSTGASPAFMMPVRLTIGQTATVVEGELNYTGSFTINTTNCANIASAAPTITSGSFVVTAIAAGQCYLGVSDAQGGSSAFAVIVSS